MIMQNGSEMTEAAPVTHSLEYVMSPRRFDSLHLLTNFEYWWNEIQFEEPFHVRSHAALLANKHCVDIFGIPTGDRERLHVRLSSW